MFGNLLEGSGGGPLAIAAGLGLVALAGVVSAVGKSASDSLSSIGSGGSSSGGSTPTVSNYGQRTSQQTVKVIAEFKLRSRDLVAIGQAWEYRSSRVN